MEPQIDRRGIATFIAFAFAIAWISGLAIALTGGLSGSPYALGLVTIGYMGAPAMAHVFTRLVTREGWDGLNLRPHLRQGWRYWAVSWVTPGLFVFLGMALFFVFFPGYLDLDLSQVRELAAATAQTMGQSTPIPDPKTVLLVQTAIAFLIAPVLNAIPILGEEFGWRAYLQPKLMPLGGKKAMFWMGLIWGVWHVPIIAMGHNYGMAYPGYPWTGMLAMTWFTFVFGTFIGWASLRAGSVWPAVIGHGALNGIAGVAALVTKGQPNPLLGPSIVGLIGSIPLSLMAFVLYLKPGSLEAREVTPTGDEPAAASA
jgi:membrane protease YdiL (CAAX protease family)